MRRSYIYRIMVALFLVPLLAACEKQDGSDTPAVPEGMVEIRPTLEGVFSSIPRDPSDAGQPGTRVYDDNTVTDGKLKKMHRLPQGSTVWLIAGSTNDNGATIGRLEKRSYVVYNPEDDPNMSYLVPCTVDDKGEMVDMEGEPFYLNDNQSYMFYGISPARKLDDAKFANSEIAFQVKNGEAFYANDCRYGVTTPQPVEVKGDNPEAVQVVKLSPMINQTAQIKIQVRRGEGVHNLDIQPSGIQVSGLQNDSPEAAADGTPSIYGDSNGLYWHMSRSKEDEPFLLQHRDKTGIYHNYDYEIDENGDVNIEVPVVPMWSLSKPVIVLLRLKVNGVPTSYELMLNEKDFKAGYSYGYRGEVTVVGGIDVVTWQFVSWDYEQPFPFK